MSAKDYTFGAGWLNIYLTKKTKTRNDGLHIMSTDRKPLEECEILYIFEHYLRHWRDEHECEVMVRQRSKGSSDFISQDGYVYLISDLDFTKVEQ